MIEVKNLKKKFGKVEAVKNVNFTAADGVITGFLGENGAGKSTTLRMIGGSLKADQGSVTIDGRLVSMRDPQSRRHLGVLSDAKGLYERLSTRENIELFGSLCGLDKSTLKDRIQSLVDLLDLSEIIDLKTVGFSTGQKMKAALARILVNRPQNLILDEPTSGLDVYSTRHLRDIIRRLRDEGICVVISTHIMQEVDALCDSIVLIDHGVTIGQFEKQHFLNEYQAVTVEDAFVSAVDRASEGRG